MPAELTKAERLQVFHVLEQELDYKQLTKPEQWHQLALQWNWDDDDETLFWIIRQPQCDRGTALYIYWHATPLSYCKYGKREDITRAWQLPTYDLIKEIEQRYLAGFYTRQEIEYDPAASTEFPDDVAKATTDELCKQRIPALLTQPTSGEPIEYVPLLDIEIRTLIPDEQHEVVSHLKQGYAVLREANLLCDPKAPPSDLIDAIVARLVAFRDSFTEYPRVAENDPILQLGWVWADQLRRAYGWQWRCRDCGVATNLGIFSPDNQYASYPPNLVRFTCVGRYDVHPVRSLFDKLRKIERSQDFSEAYGSGWLRHYP